MKKILILNTTFAKGGAAKVAHTLFSEFKDVFDIHFAYGRGQKVDNEKTFYFGNKIEFLIHAFLVRFLGIEGYGTYFSTRKLIKYIKKEKFDIINIHNLHGYYINFFQLFSFFKKEKTKIIYSLHDEWAINCLLAHSMGCAHCKTGIGKCTSSYSYPKTYSNAFNRVMLEKKKQMFLGMKNIKIVCPSKWLAGEVQKSFLSNFDIDVIYNGIDASIFKPVENKDILRVKYNFPTDRKIITFSAANLKDKNKGISFIVELAKNRKDFLFLGIGAGEFRYDNIVTTGYLDDSQKIAEMYALSDVFISASQAETFSLACVEAMAVGVPVVGLDIPVLHEILKGSQGVLVEGTIEHFVDAILVTSSCEKQVATEVFYDKKDFLNSYKSIFRQYV